MLHFVRNDNIQIGKFHVEGLDLSCFIHLKGWELGHNVVIRQGCSKAIFHFSKDEGHPEFFYRCCPWYLKTTKGVCPRSNMKAAVICLMITKGMIYHGLNLYISFLGLNLSFNCVLKMSHLNNAYCILLGMTISK